MNKSTTNIHPQHPWRAYQLFYFA